MLDSQIDKPESIIWGTGQYTFRRCLMSEMYGQFGVAIQSLPARLAPVAVDRVLAHFKENRQEGESFRAYVLRHKVETFRKLTADLVKPPLDAPEMFRDWGDEIDYSLELGRGECAA